MRQLVLLATWSFLGATLIVSGVYLVLPGRNAIGDPRREREMASCVLPDRAEVRLYQADADSSSASWFSVTHDPEGPLPEKQILYRKRPALYDLVCDSVGVIIRTDAEPITLSADSASHLRAWSPGSQPRPIRRWGIGGALVLAGLALLWFLRPKPGDESIF